MWVFGSQNWTRRYLTTQKQSRCSSWDAKTTDKERDLDISRNDRIIQEIHSELCIYCSHFLRFDKKCMPDKIVWTDQTQQVFDTLKTALTSSTVMRNLDPKQTFILQTDASNIWVGAVLSQGQEEHLIAYFSRNCLTWRGIIQLLRRSAVQLYCQSSTSMCICWESHLSYKLITKH